MYAASALSGPMCLSEKVSRAENNDVGSFVVASPRRKATPEMAIHRAIHRVLSFTLQFAIFRNSRRPSLSACYHSISRATTYVKNFFLFPNWEIAAGSEHPRLVSSRVSGTWLNLESLNQEWGEVAEPFPKHQPSIMGPFSLRT